ncbi:unnamed protein product, partial [Prunus brigantina]
EVEKPYLDRSKWCSESPERAMEILDKNRPISCLFQRPRWRLVEDNVLVLLIPIPSLGVPGGGYGGPKTVRMNSIKGERLLFSNGEGLLFSNSNKNLTERQKN